MFHVYVIEDQRTHKWYIGFTNDVKRRLAEHRQHKNDSTSHHDEWQLIYCESYLNKGDAIGREKFLKSGSGWRFLKKQLKHYLEEQRTYRS